MWRWWRWLWRAMAVVEGGGGGCGGEGVRVGMCSKLQHACMPASGCSVTCASTCASTRCAATLALSAHAPHTRYDAGVCVSLCVCLVCVSCRCACARVCVCVWGVVCVVGGRVAPQIDDGDHDHASPQRVKLMRSGHPRWYVCMAMPAHSVRYMCVCGDACGAQVATPRPTRDRLPSH